ncbi:MAG: oligosaccharide flippase family protein [Bacteroidetes bacterium]|nr:oligosaccharide flippase family protein [Bacteroidota bacterium]
MKFLFKNRIYKNLIWNLLTKALVIVFKFITIPVLITEFSDSGYGLLILATSILVYLKILELGTPLGVIKFVAEWLTKKDYDSIHKVSSSYFIIYFVIGSINLLLFILLALYGRNIFFENLTVSDWQTFQVLLYIAAFSSFISYFSSLFKQLLTGAEEIAWLSKIDLIKKSLEVFIIAFIIIFPGRLTLINYYLLIQITNIILLPLMMIKWGKRTSIQKSLFSGWYGRYFLTIFKYGLGIFAIEIFRVSFFQLRPIILQMRSMDENVAVLVGHFGVLLTITSIIDIAAGSLMTVLVPAFSRMLTEEHNYQQRNAIFNGYTRKFTAIFLLPISIVIVVAPEFLEAYLGKDYIFLSPYLRIWLFFSCFNIVTSIYTSAIFAVGKIQQFFWFIFTNSIVSTLIIWFLTPSLDLWAAVIGTSFFFLSKFLFFIIYFTPKILNLKIKGLLESITPAISTSIITIIGGILFVLNIPQVKNPYIIILLTTSFLVVLYGLIYFTLFISRKRLFLSTLIDKIFHEQ